MSDWEEMIQMYDLEDCVWLENLYARQREVSIGI